MLSRSAGNAAWAAGARFLSGLRVFVSPGLHDRSQRLQAELEASGAQMGWSAGDARLTHILCSDDADAPSARAPPPPQGDGPFVVTERWLEACQQRGLRADEADYLIGGGQSAAKRARRR